MSKKNNILNDSRFTKLLNDPKYREIPRVERKVKIDKRFQSMFDDDKFKVKYTVDKRGRPVNQSSTEHLQRFYELSSEESSDESEDEDADGNDRETEDSNSGKFVRAPSSDGEEVLKEDNVSQKEKMEIEPKNDKLQRGTLSDAVKKRLKDFEVDYARGEGVLFSDSSSDEESDVEDDDVDASEELKHEWGELDGDAETTEESTKRLAACNMDWDNMKALDIMVLFNSFLPPGGVIHKVSVYPSEFGLQRMKEEEVNGPMELTTATEERKQSEKHNTDEDEEGSYYHMERLRQYQLNRLKYYYAVIECDSVATADKLYSECDGLEYESSATRLDLRFIGDDVTFDEKPRETCTGLPDLSKYRPRLFTTTALQQAKVELTWDVTNPDRMDAIRKALDGETDEANLKEYLASSSSDSEHGEEDDEVENGEDPIQKYRNLLQDIKSKDDDKKNKDVEMEITWGMGLKEKTEALVKKKMQNETERTPFEQFLEKRKEKRKQKKLEKQKKDELSGDGESDNSDDIPSDIDMNDPYFAEEMNNSEFKTKSAKKKPNKRQNVEDESDEESKRKREELELLLDDDDDGKAHFSLKKIQEAENDTKSKRKRKLKMSKRKETKATVPDFEINPNDERFSAIYTSHHYNIDPTDPNFKKTKAMDTLIQEKLKRRPKEMPVEDVPVSKQAKTNAAMNVLIKSIKRKTQCIGNNKN